MSNKPKDFRYNYLDKTVNVANYKLQMFNKILSMFKYHNLPDSIPQIELEKIIIKGFAGIAKVNDKLYAFSGGLGGELDEYYRPTILTVANPYLKFNKDLKINEECVIIRNDSFMLGMFPLVEKYAFLQNENDVSRVIAMVNTRLQLILSAKDDNTRNSANEFIQRLFDGKLTTISDNAFLESLDVHTPTTQNNQQLNNLITHDQYLRACFLNDIGLQANTQLKKERLVSSEVENNAESLYPIVDDMLENRRVGIEKVNEMFGTDISVEFSSSWDYRIFQGADIHNTDEEVDKDELDEEEEKEEDKEEEEKEEDKEDEEKEEDKEDEEKEEDKEDEEKSDA